MKTALIVLGLVAYSVALVAIGMALPAAQEARQAALRAEMGLTPAAAAPASYKGPDCSRCTLEAWRACRSQKSMSKTKLES